MLPQNTRCAGATQASLEAWAQTTDAAPARARVRADRAVAPIEQERIRRKFAWLAELKKALRSAAGRTACKEHKVSHRLVADLAEEIAGGRYPSFMKLGEVWVGQDRLAGSLSVHERQVRRAVAVLVALNFLRVERECRGRRRDTNRMVAVLHDRPLFEPVDAHNRTSASAGDRTSGSSDYRACRPSNSCEEEAKKDSSPVGPSPTASGASTEAQRREEGAAIQATARCAEGAHDMPRAASESLPEHALSPRL